jgi:hypothetical protein
MPMGAGVRYPPPTCQQSHGRRTLPDTSSRCTTCWGPCPNVLPRRPFMLVYPMCARAVRAQPCTVRDTWCVQQVPSHSLIPHLSPLPVGCSPQATCAVSCHPGRASQPCALGLLQPSCDATPVKVNSIQYNTPAAAACHCLLLSRHKQCQQHCWPTDMIGSSSVCQGTQGCIVCARSSRG